MPSCAQRAQLHGRSLAYRGSGSGRRAAEELERAMHTPCDGPGSGPNGAEEALSALHGANARSRRAHPDPRVVVYRQHVWASAVPAELFSPRELRVKDVHWGSSNPAASDAVSAKLVAMSPVGPAAVLSVQ